MQHSARKIFIHAQLPEGHDHWRDKETTRDAVRVTIHDYLWSDDTGLPIDTYTEDDVNDKAEEIFRHVYRAYPTLPSPFYASGSVAG